MTLPLQALAVGAMVAGFVGIPAALGGGNAIEHFLEPSFTADTSRRPKRRPARRRSLRRRPDEHEGSTRNRTPRAAWNWADGVLRAGRRRSASASRSKFYVTSPEISDSMARAWAGAHRVLSNKYYVDELYNATVISGTFAAGTRPVGGRSQRRRRRRQRQRAG